MKALIFVITTAAMMSLSGQGIAQQQQSPQATTVTNYSRSELKSMRLSAHTPEQYQVLASYFRQRQETYQRQADDLYKEFQRRSQNVIGPGVNNPRPVDATRNLYKYYVDEANQMSKLAAQYEAQLGQSAQPPARP
jgi:hypothetical protein